MGCVVSKHGEHMPFLPQAIPEVTLDVGTEVEDMTPPRHSGSKIVFVFGGPGSRKGRIVNDLVQGFGFYAINAETLILSQLTDDLAANENDPACVVSNAQRTKYIQEKLKEEPSLLTLEWVLGLIKKELKSASENGHSYFLIDLVPNLRSMLQVCSFTKGCELEMEQFENEWPYLFALDLAIKDNKAVKNLANASHHNSLTLKNGLSDERDMNKTKKRYEEYSSSVKDFLQYFENHQKLVTVDVSCGIADLIWVKVSEFFFSVGFKRRNALNTVILFVPRSDDVSSIDLQRYRMEIIPVQNLDLTLDQTMDDLARALSDYIENSHLRSESFILDMQGTSISDTTSKEKITHGQLGKHVIFIDKDDKQLNQYIYVTPEKPKRSETFPLTLKAVSTTENEIFLFPEDAEMDLCKHVAIVYEDSKGTGKRLQQES